MVTSPTSFLYVYFPTLILSSYRFIYIKAIGEVACGVCHIAALIFLDFSESKTLMILEHNHKRKIEKRLKTKKIWSPKATYLNCFVLKICSQAVQLPLFGPLVDTVPEVIFGWNSGVSKSYYHTLNLLFIGPKYSRLPDFFKLRTFVTQLGRFCCTVQNFSLFTYQVQI